MYRIARRWRKPGRVERRLRKAPAKVTEHGKQLGQNRSAPDSSSRPSRRHPRRPRPAPSTRNWKQIVANLGTTVDELERTLSRRSSPQWARAGSDSIREDDRLKRALTQREKRLVELSLWRDHQLGRALPRPPSAPPAHQTAGNARTNENERGGFQDWCRI